MYDLEAHNPKVVGSNPTPATMGAERLNLEAPFLVTVTSRAAIPSILIHRCIVVPVPQIGNNWEQIATDRPFYGESGFTL